MKICIVAPFADPEKGAAIVRLNSFRDYFQSKGHKVLILSTLRGNLKSTKNLMRYSGLINLIKLLFTMDFNVLIGISPPITHVFFSLIVCKIKGKPLVLDSKDIFTHTATMLGIMKKGSIKYHIYMFMEILTHKYADRILVLDNHIGNWLAANYSINKIKISLAANGVDTTIIRKSTLEGKKSRKKLNVPLSSTLTIYLGGLGDERYIQFLEETADIIKKYNAHILFLIASDETPTSKRHLAEIYFTVEKLGIKKQFHILKNIEHSQVYKYLSAADIGVDFYENFEFFAVTVKILEYMACGLPVIVKMPKKNKMFQKFFKKYDIGYISADWKIFRQHFADALTNIKSFKRKGSKGVNIIKNEYTRDITNKKVLKILFELTNN